jgi:TetR/AcrR family transcriptional regulator
MYVSIYIHLIKGIMNTKEKIEDVALKLFVDKTYKGTTMDDIAEAANVSSVTVFRKFKTKDNLLKAVVKKNWDEFQLNLEKIFSIDPDSDVQSQLRDQGKVIRKFMDDRIDLIILIMGGALRKPELAEILSTMQIEIVEYYSEYFKKQVKLGKLREINTDVAAMILTSYIFFNTLLIRIAGKDLFGDRMKRFDDFIDILTKGILNLGEK